MHASIEPISGKPEIGGPSGALRAPPCDSSLTSARRRRSTSAQANSTNCVLTVGDWKFPGYTALYTLIVTWASPSC
jgi:hypothetical protein